MSILELDTITLCRQRNLILDRVSWTIRKGEHWALLGANGSGKTSLLKVITAYEWPTSGTARVLGELYGTCDVRRIRRTIGWVSSALESRIPPEDTALDVVASGYDASFGLLRPLEPGERAQAGDALAAIGGEPFAIRPFGLLSQGERQRTLIARALVHRPALLVLDEPTAGLDPAAREAFLADLAALAARPEAPTVVLVTHHIDEIGPWISRVLVLRRGRVLRTGTPDEVLTSHTLGEAFGRSCVVYAMDGRTWLRLT